MKRRTFGTTQLTTSEVGFGLLEGKFSLQTTFARTDHRRHRPRRWLLEGVPRVERLRFMEIAGERSLLQAAVQFILSRPAIACVLPTVTRVAELEEYAGAVEAPLLSDGDLRQVAEALACPTIAA
jgi:aryl-alcohol dehydrogenase-like predicted oxidoreductase